MILRNYILLISIFLPHIIWKMPKMPKIVVSLRSVLFLNERSMLAVGKTKIQ